MTLIERVRVVLKETGKSQTAIANDLHVTSAYIWKILNKDDVNPSANFMREMCNAYGISYDWLLFEKGNQKTEANIVKGIIKPLLPDNEFAINTIAAMAEMPLEWWQDMERLVKQLYEKTKE